MRIKASVTDTHISDGTRGDCYQHPIAFAILDGEVIGGEGDITSIAVNPYATEMVVEVNTTEYEDDPLVFRVEDSRLEKWILDYEWEIDVSPIQIQMTCGLAWIE